MRQGPQDLTGRGASPDALADALASGAGVSADKPSRRHFLKLMAAGAGLAGLTSCRWPKENILPYAHRPPEIEPGNPIYFATSMDIAGAAQGLVVTSYDGRPIKVDGNGQHPINRGRTDAQAQASILDLYDPDRSQNPIQLAGRRHFDRKWESFDDFAREHFARLRQTEGRGLFVLSEASSSPSVRDMRARFARAFPHARWYEYEPISRDNERAGSVLASGGYYRTHHRFDRAAAVVSLDSDFLVTHPAALGYARDFAEAHTPTLDSRTMSRLYVVESAYTNTGAMADERLRAASSSVWQVACALGSALIDAGVASAELPPAMIEALRRQAGSARLAAFVQAAARDLAANRGRSIVIAGADQPAHAHALVHVLNAALGNVGQTIWYTDDPEEDRPDHVQAIGELVDAMRGGQVETLLILGGNPVYDAPADLEFAATLSRVPTSIHLSLYWDETSRLSTWHLPRAHYLEAWGDTRAYDGTYAPAQPLIRPLYDGRSVIEVLSQVTETPALSGYEIVRRTVRRVYEAQGGHCPQPNTSMPTSRTGSTGERGLFAREEGVAPEILHGARGNRTIAGRMNDEQFEAFWRELLNNGVLANAPDAGQAAEGSNRRPKLRTQAVVAAVQRVPPQQPLGPQNLEIVFRPDRKVYDGRFANNGWLQELPDIMTKVTWDNAVLMAPATAAALGVAQGQVIEVRRAGGRIVAPAYVMPGTAPFSLTVTLGYGRKAAGNVGNDVGVNAYPLRTSQAMYWADGVTIRPTRRMHHFAVTQDRERPDWIGGEGTKVRMEDLVQEATLAEYRQNPVFARERSGPLPPEQLWAAFPYKGYKWGMAIDMQKCIGCNACTVACMAENNSVVVGPDQVRRGRHMQWLRIDRYLRGDAAWPHVSFQPMFCVHCENAPCESVCPVAATLHDEDGLNLMVYNRCVGTRYCSNNCPYKVRRFNFYHYTLGLPLVRRMQMNPDVTVRSRGVMEKCTYCIQRIQRAKIRARSEGRAIRDGEITPACAQACPTGAIVFGDLNDPNSGVSQWHTNDRAYAVLRELNTRPRTLHLARVRNPAPVDAGTRGHRDAETQ